MGGTRTRTPTRAGRKVLSRNDAIESGDRFTRSRGAAEKRHLDGKLGSHRWVTGCRRWSIRDRTLSLSLRALRGSACECYRMDTAQFPVSRFQFPGYAGGVEAGSPGLARERLPGVGSCEGVAPRRRCEGVILLPPPPGLGIHFAGSPVSLRDPVSAGRNDGVLQKWSPRPSSALRAEYAHEYVGGHLETGLWQLAPGLW